MIDGYLIKILSVHEIFYDIFHNEEGATYTRVHCASRKNIL